jgi:hypothetical protein
MQKHYETETNIRSYPVRIGVLALAAITIFGMTSLGREHTARTDATAPHSMASIFTHSTERENETTRMPVRFDDGLRNPTTGGI